MQYDLVAIENIPRSTKDPLSEMNLVEVFKICNQMEKVCRDKDGIGLSAVQIGLPLDLFVILRGNSFEYYLNCKYESEGETITSIEGCLSIRDSMGSIRRFELQRYATVTVKGQRINFQNDLLIEEFSSLETGLYSVVFQHEIDHSFGLLISEKGREVQIS